MGFNPFPDKMSLLIVFVGFSDILHPLFHDKNNCITLMGNFLKKDNKKEPPHKHDATECVVVFIDAYSDFLPGILDMDEYATWLKK